MTNMNSHGSHIVHCYPVLPQGVVGATNMNAHSSRSHAIFTVTVECSEKGPDGKHHVRVGKLHLVDLAVSDRAVFVPVSLAVFCCIAIKFAK